MGKLVKCKTCGEEIAKSARACPKCGAKQKKHTVLGIVIVIFGILLIFAAIGSSGGNGDTDSRGVSSSREPDDVQAKVEEEPLIELTAGDLWAAYDENEVNADNLYKDKKVCVTGTVFEIGKELITNTPFIALKAEDSLGIYAVQCFFQDSSEHDKVAEIKDGDTITIIGTCSGKTINIMLQRCTIKND